MRFVGFSTPQYYPSHSDYSFAHVSVIRCTKTLESFHVIQNSRYRQLSKGGKLVILGVVLHGMRKNNSILFPLSIESGTWQ